MAVGRQLVLALATLAAALPTAAVTSASAQPGAATLPPNAAAPWSDPTHHGPLEQLAGAVASTLAGRQVAVRCESPDAWQALVSASGDTELGFVPLQLDAAGTIADDASLVELSPQVCLQLQQFAAAAPKPTTCSQRTVRTAVVQRTRRVTVRRRVIERGRSRLVTSTISRRVRTAVRRVTAGPPGPCFRDGRPLAGGNAFWSAYASTATALLVLAHESVHLVQDRAGRPLPPTEQAESEAKCVGMQWLYAVAEQLGDSPDDAEAIAQYAYDDLYPSFRGTPYWSPACAPGGALDRRTPGTRSWP